MPNAQNITRPITLISYGRSGTSLVHNVIADHPDVDGCGETGALLHGVWASSQKVKGVVRNDYDLGRDVDMRLRSGKAVRAVFLSHFKDEDRSRWVHKPINVPATIAPEPQTAAWRVRKAAGTYWDAMAYSFPDSINITVLRHPYDVITSARAFWGFDVAHIWQQLVNMAVLIDHEQSDIAFAVSYERMSRRPKAEIKRLLDHVGLDERPACYRAAKQVWVPHEPEKAEALKGRKLSLGGPRFSYKERWSEIDRKSFRRADKDILIKMWARFGETLQL